jgi:hypothetical protein
MRDQLSLAEGQVSTEALEHELARLPDVSAARVVVDDEGRPVEIHVLAASDKHPKQIVRDVQSVAMASFGLDLDRRVVSVVRLQDSVDAEPAGSRVVLRSVFSDQHGQRALFRVTLARGTEEWVGSAEGSLASSARLRLAATATLDALRRFMPIADAADIETAAVVKSSERSVVVVNVVFGFAGREEAVSGSAVVRDAGEIDATVRAVLDATNRRLPMLQDMERNAAH